MFDALYAAFGVVIIVVLVVTVAIGVRRSDAGPAIAAIGFSLLLVAGVGFNALLRSGQISDLAFLQIHFPIFYLGFALILAGADRVLGVRRRIGWLLFVLACVAAAVYLLTPILASYATAGGTLRVSQQVIFYLPLFVGIALIAIASYRARSWGVEAFALLVLAGVVRESGAIPSFGDAYLDLLGAFVPFTLAALCLGARAWSRGTFESTHPAKQLG